MDALGWSEQVGCATSCASEGAAGRRSEPNSQPGAPPLPCDPPALAPAAKTKYLAAGPGPCSIQQGAPYPADEQSAVLPEGLLLARWQGLPTNPPHHQRVGSQQRQQEQHGEEAQRAGQLVSGGLKSQLTISAEELEWLCTILPEGGGTCTDSGSWHATAQAAAAMLRPERSAASSTALPPMAQLLGSRQQQAGGDASSRMSWRTSPWAGAAHVPWPGMHMPSSSLHSTGSLANGSQWEAPRYQLPLPVQHKPSSSARWQSAQVLVRQPSPAALAIQPAAAGHALPKAPAAQSLLYKRPGGSSPAAHSKCSQQATSGSQSASQAAAPASDVIGGAGGRGGGPPLAPRQRRFGSRYSKADLEVLKVEEPQKWRRIMTNRKSLAAHLARRQQQQEQGVHASQEARHGGQKKRRWAKQLLGAEDAKEGCDSGEPSHGASRHADTKA